MNDACELCGKVFDKAVWKNDLAYLIDASDEIFPCFLRLVCRRHVKEMSDLSVEEQEGFWRMLRAVEETIIRRLQAHKVNYAQFGNMVPHLHWHVIARWRDDAFFPESPWGRQQREADPEVSRSRLALKDEMLEELVCKLEEA